MTRLRLNEIKAKMMLELPQIADMEEYDEFAEWIVEYALNQYNQGVSEGYEDGYDQASTEAAEDAAGASL